MTIHHVTAIASDPQRTLDFYVGLLGLRLVKRTINFDDPGTYHFYFGDAVGTPGTILTFFPWPGARHGQPGPGQATRIAFQVARGSLAVRLHIAAEAIDDWDSSRMEEIGRRIETAAALAAEKERAAISPANDPSKPDDPVINIDRIKKRWRRESVLATEDQARDPERRSTTAQT